MSSTDLPRFAMIGSRVEHLAICIDYCLLFVVPAGQNKRLTSRCIVKILRTLRRGRRSLEVYLASHDASPVFIIRRRLIPFVLFMRVLTSSTLSVHLAAREPIAGRLSSSIEIECVSDLAIIVTRNGLLQTENSNLSINKYRTRPKILRSKYNFATTETMILVSCAK